jgi:hypothetical protein
VLLAISPHPKTSRLLHSFLGGAKRFAIVVIFGDGNVSVSYCSIAG